MVCLDPGVSEVLPQHLLLALASAVRLDWGLRANRGWPWLQDPWVNAYGINYKLRFQKPVKARAGRGELWWSRIRFLPVFHSPGLPLCLVTPLAPGLGSRASEFSSVQPPAQPALQQWPPLRSMEELRPKSGKRKWPCHSQIPLFLESGCQCPEREEQGDQPSRNHRKSNFQQATCSLNYDCIR